MCIKDIKFRLFNQLYADKNDHIKIRPRIEIHTELYTAS